MYRDYSQVYTSISGLKFSSNGATQSYHPVSYYSLSRMCDGNLKNAYIVQSSYTNVVITVTLPRSMFIHHIRLYPVCSTHVSVLAVLASHPKGNFWHCNALLKLLIPKSGQHLSCLLTSVIPCQADMSRE